MSEPMSPSPPAPAVGGVEVGGGGSDQAVGPLQMLQMCCRTDAGSHSA